MRCSRRWYIAIQDHIDRNPCKCTCALIIASILHRCNGSSDSLSEPTLSLSLRARFSRQLPSWQPPTGRVVPERSCFTESVGYVTDDVGVASLATFSSTASTYTSE